MRKRLAPALVGGVVLWGILTVACSSAIQRPASGGAGWSGTLGAAPGEAEPRGRPFVVSYDKDARTDTLYRVSPRTMDVTDPLRLDTRGTTAHGVSPDGSLLLATAKDGVHVVDVASKTVRSSDPGVRWVREAFWVDDDVVILVADARGATKLIRVRPSTGAVLGRESFRGTFFAAAGTGDGVVLLASAYEPEAPEPLPATLALMDAAGNFATVELEEIGAGIHSGPEGDGTERALPALAVGESTATVVGTDGTIASVDLATLDVTVDGADHSLLDRLAAWFVPPAHAKTFDGTELRAEWAGPDALLVSGYTTANRRTHPAGAVLLDPDDWSATVVDDDAYAAALSGDRLLAWKSLMPGDERGEGIGLRAYGPDGELEWQTLDRQFVRLLTVHRGIAFVEHGWGRILVSSVDLGTGRVLATRHSHLRVLAL